MDQFKNAQTTSAAASRPGRAPLVRILIALLLLGCLAGVVLGPMLAMPALDWFFYDVVVRTRKFQFAIYENMRFVGDARSTTVTQFETGEIEPHYDESPPRKGVATLLLKWPNGNVTQLGELNEHEVINYASTHQEGPPQTYEAGAEYNIINIGFGFATFRRGKVVYLRLDAGSELAIGRTPTGPFYKLPMEKDKMVEVFGEPLRWKTVRSKNVH